MKFTFIKLAENNEIINAALLPEKHGSKYLWTVNDVDLLEYDVKTKQFNLEIYEFIDDDYQVVNTLGHDQAYQVALQAGIVYA